MKRIYYFLFLLSFLFISNSCEENGIFFPESDNNAVFEAKINGALFSTSEVGFVNDNNTIVITAIDRTTSEIFTLNVEDFAIRTYSLEGINNFVNYIQNDQNSANIWSTYGETSSKGTITFTEIDFVNNMVSGTFNFIGTNITTGSKSAFTDGIFTNVPVSDTQIAQDSFTAKVDGIVFEQISLFANEIIVSGTNLISISANKSLTETINFNLNANITPGEYDFGSFITQTYPTGQYTLDSNSYQADGKIIITSHDTSAKIISGTFNFDATDPLTSAPVHSITEGAFSISY